MDEQATKRKPGRPRGSLSGKYTAKPLTIRWGPEEREALAYLVEHTGEPVAALVRRLVREAAERRKAEPPTPQDSGEAVD